MLSYYNTTKEIKERNPDTAIIPIGSIEQHGSHLPIGVDFFTADAYSRAVAEKTGALLYPPLPFSTCYEHKGTSGSLGLRPTTLYSVIEDLVLGLYEQGIRKIVFIICHGGVFIAAPAIRELNALHDDLAVISVSSSLPSRAGEVLENTDVEIHAGEKETSLMLYLHPDTVNKAEMMKNDFTPNVPRDYLNYTPLRKLSPSGVWGKPSLASKEKGEQIFNIIVDAMVDYIEDAFKNAYREKWQD